MAGNFVTWRNKKQHVVSRSSAEVEYSLMTQVACELVWLKLVLAKLGFTVKAPMPMQCDNQAAMFIAHNPTFLERTKHIEVDYYYIRDIVMRGVISSPYTPSSKQWADIFSKG